jgi:phosphoribosylglycinamide formyltransferase-1
MYKIAVFVSGRGSNLKSIEAEIKHGNLNAEISLIVSNKECEALEFAKSVNIPFYIVSSCNAEGTIDYNKLIKELLRINIDLIVLAGFLKKIPIELIRTFKNKIINIHPALLPSFGGKGMYGMNVHRAVFNSSAKVSGPTVHFVDEIYDNGKIISQKAVDISDVKTPEEIAERVLSVEHKLLPEVINLFVEGKILVTKNRVFLDLGRDCD